MFGAIAVMWETGKRSNMNLRKSKGRLNEMKNVKIVLFPSSQYKCLSMQKDYKR